MHTPSPALWWVALLATTLSTAQAQAATVTVGSDKVIRVDGTPFFPIMQWAQCGSRVAHQATLGINTFVGNGCSADSSTDFLADCQASGVWGVVSPGDMSVQNHPALLGWIFGDEPDLQGNATEPADILSEYHSIKAADPDHITFLTVTAGFYSGFDPPAWMGGSRDRYSGYGAATDVYGFDHYPVYGWCQPDWLDQIGDAHDELLSFAPDPATYQWIECTDESSQWCELCDRCDNPPGDCSRENPCPGDGVRPDEVRNEVWQAITHGATAIGYFTHAWECPDYTQFCVGAALEAELIRTNNQISALGAVLLSPPYSGAVTAQGTGSARVDVMARASGSELYIIVVNTGREAQQVTISASGMQNAATVEVYDEARQVQATGTSFSDSFEPLAVHIYVVPLVAATDAGSPSDANGVDVNRVDARLVDSARVDAAQPDVSGTDTSGRDTAMIDAASRADAPLVADIAGSGGGVIMAGCGCASRQPATGLWATLALVIFARQRRRW